MSSADMGASEVLPDPTVEPGPAVGDKTKWIKTVKYIF